MSARPRIKLTSDTTNKATTANKRQTHSCQNDNRNSQQRTWVLCRMRTNSFMKRYAVGQLKMIQRLNESSRLSHRVMNLLWALQTLLHQLSLQHLIKVTQQNSDSASKTNSTSLTLVSQPLYLLRVNSSRNGSLCSRRLKITRMSLTVNVEIEML